MRYLLIALMIVLLPLRGWAGNAMAVDMAGQQVLMAQASATSTAVMPADCPMHLPAVNEKAVDGKLAEGDPDQTSTAGAHCHSCDTCQLCLALASWAHTTWTAGTVSPPTAPLLAGRDFHSADPAASFKPPIS